MRKKRVHILYEYGPDLRPHGSAFVRLLRPLTHPAFNDALEVTTGLDYGGQDVDAVIIDRFWRKDLSPELAIRLVEDIRRAGACFIYALDDNLLELPSYWENWLTERHRWAVQILLSQADSVWVTTPELRDQLSKFNPRILVLPNALDEQLLIGGRSAALVQSPFGEKRKVIGYMGTKTHDDDLLMILTALQEICQRRREEVTLEFVGVVQRQDTLEVLEGMPVRMVSPRPEEIAYPLFMMWFTSRIQWDIAIAPLADTRFNQCKSDIKFLDYCAIGAAGVYSRAPAYSSSVRHLETGWLTENNLDAWVEALDELLCDECLRARLVQNATRYLYSERIVARNARCWLNAFARLDLGSRFG